MGSLLDYFLTVLLCLEIDTVELPGRIHPTIKTLKNLWQNVRPLPSADQKRMAMPHSPDTRAQERQI
jgi:hypothetical protein